MNLNWICCYWLILGGPLDQWFPNGKSMWATASDLVLILSSTLGRVFNETLGNRCAHSDLINQILWELALQTFYARLYVCCWHQLAEGLQYCPKTELHSMLLSLLRVYLSIFHHTKIPDSYLLYFTRLYKNIFFP